MYEIPRLAIEVISAVLYFILVKYMIKPYYLTKEIRHLGLPLGFFFLGLSEVILASQIIQPISELNGFSVTIRTFAFILLAMTYYFSKKSSDYSQIVWSITISIIIVSLAFFCIILLVSPVINLEIPKSLSIFLRFISLFFLAYVCIHTLWNHVKNITSSTFWIPLGFALLAISQYSQLIRMIDGGYAYGFAFVGALVARFLSLAVFLYVAYTTFHERTIKGKNT